MMIPRTLVKHQYKSVGLGTKGGSGGPAVLTFPVKGTRLVQLQPSNTAEQRLCFGWVRHSEKEWGAVQVSVHVSKNQLLCRQVNAGSSKGLAKALWGV